MHELNLCPLSDLSGSHRMGSGGEKLLFRAASSWDPFEAPPDYCNRLHVGQLMILSSVDMPGSSYCKKLVRSLQEV